MIPSSTVTVINVIVPYVFTLVSKLELRSDEARDLQVTLLRAVIFRVAVVGTYIAHFFRNHDSTTEICWETRVGQELYRLVITFFLLHVVTTTVFHFGVALVHRIIPAAPSPPRFHLSNNVLDLVYLQTLLWIGTVFVPLLPAIVSAIMLVLFFIKMLVVFYASKEVTQLWHLGGQAKLFFQLLVFGFLMASVPVTWALTLREPGQCGPFAGRNRVYEVVPDTIESFPQLVRDALFFVGSASFCIPLLVILFLFMYYLRFNALARRQVAVELSHRLVLGRLDIMHLLRKRKIHD
eukprot:m.134594 g.134594  ORF g.134594 m.134594 type:complete len:294 (+) comp9872_c0_seq2:1988-2869(+)